MTKDNSPPPLMTDKELLMETGAFNEIMNAAFEYADAYCASGDEPRRYSAAIDHLRKTVRAEITKFSRANYKTNAATEFDAQAVAAQAPAAVAVPDEREAFALEIRKHSPHARLECHDGQYASPWVQAAWTGFSLRAALAATPAAKAEVQIANAMSREECMIVLQRNADGTPTVWCDPEIADVVRALNSGGIKTVASCSGHGEKPGGIALADGRQLLLLESLEAFSCALRAISDQAEVQTEPVALQMCSELKPRSESEKAAYLAGVADGRMYAERDADTAPQAQPADALAEPVAQLIGVDEYGPRLNWFKHWVDLPKKALLYTAPHAAALNAETPYQRDADAQGAPR